MIARTRLNVTLYVHCLCVIFGENRDIRRLAFSQCVSTYITILITKFDRVLLSSRLLSKNLKIKIYRTIILPVVLYGCETWSLTLREERKLRVFENMVLRRIFETRRDEVTGNGGDCITRS